MRPTNENFDLEAQTTQTNRTAENDSNNPPPNVFFLCLLVNPTIMLTVATASKIPELVLNAWLCFAAYTIFAYALTKYITGDYPSLFCREVKTTAEAETKEEGIEKLPALQN